MDKYKIIGTSHVSHESKKIIKQAFFEYEPDMIGVELDKNRFLSLKKETNTRPSLKSVFSLGITGYLFAIIAGFIQRRIGRIMNVQPGQEFLLSANLAKNNGLPLYLIDRDIRITLKRLGKTVSFREKMRILKDLIWPFGRKKMKFDLAKIPNDELVKRLTSEMKKRYPGIYKALVDERNIFMAKQVYFLLQRNPGKKILVVIGAGHKEGFEYYLNRFLKDNSLEIIK